MNIDGTGANQTVGGSATGDFTVTDVANLGTDELDATNISLTGTGDITNMSGRLVNTVTLNGAGVSAQTETGGLVVTGSGLVDIDNFNTDLDPMNINTAGDIDLTTTGAANLGDVTGDNVNVDAGGALTRTVAGTVTGNTVILNGTSIDAQVSTTDLTATTSSGQAVINGLLSALNLNINTAGADASVTSAGNLTGNLTASLITLNATGGDVNITNDNHVNTRTVSGTNVTVTSNNGNVTGLSDSLNGADVTVNAPNGSVNVVTQAGVNLNSNADGDLTIDNTSATVNANVNSAHGAVNLTQSGNLTGSVAAATEAILSAADINVDVTTPVVDATATGDLTMDNTGNLVIDNFVSDPISPVSLSAAGDVDFSTPGSASFSLLNGANVNVDIGGAFTAANLTTNLFTVSDLDVDSTCLEQAVSEHLFLNGSGKDAKR